MRSIELRFAAKYSVFVLKGNDVHVRTIKVFGGLSVVADRILADLQLHLAWIFIFGPGLRHRQDEGLEIWIVL